jgi:Mn-dependent DtxR family transcriptional regulator
MEGFWLIIFSPPKAYTIYYTFFNTYVMFLSCAKRECFSSKTLVKRLKELDESGILERQAYNEIPPRVEYRLKDKGKELIESVIRLLNWMKNGLR